MTVLTNTGLYVSIPTYTSLMMIIQAQLTMNIHISIHFEVNTKEQDNPYLYFFQFWNISLNSLYLLLDVSFSYRSSIISYSKGTLEAI